MFHKVVCPTWARCDGIFDILLTANLLRNLPVKKNLIGQDLTELWSWICGPIFWPTLWLICKTSKNTFQIDRSISLANAAFGPWRFLYRPEATTSLVVSAKRDKVTCPQCMHQNCQSAFCFWGNEKWHDTADSQLESRIEEQSNHSLNLNWALGKILNKRKRQPL